MSNIKTWKERQISDPTIPRMIWMDTEITDLRTALAERDAEIERLGKEYVFQQSQIKQFEQEYVAHKAEIERLQADAARYQWWVSTMTSKDAATILYDAFFHLPHDIVPSEAQFNEVIDAALKESK